MSASSLLHPRSRRSRSSTPLIPNGISETLDTSRENEHGLLQDIQKGGADGTPIIRRKKADASYRNDDKVSPMLEKLRMTPGDVFFRFDLLS